MSNSLDLKNSGGGGDVGAITCFEDSIDSPAKTAAAGEARASNVKTNNFLTLERRLPRGRNYGIPRGGRGARSVVSVVFVRILLVVVVLGRARPFLGWSVPSETCFLRSMLVARG